MMGRGKCLVALVVLFLFCGAATAGQPIRFNYQAKLMDGSGSPLQSTHTLHIGLYDGGSASLANDGTLLFGETADVYVVNGVVNYVVGTGANTFGGVLTGAMFAGDNPVFVQVAVDSLLNVVLPRVRLESVPFAAHAANGLPAGFLTLGLSAMPPSGFSATGIRLYNSWQQRATFLTARYGCGVASANGKVYVVGGLAQSAGLPLGVTEEYNPSTNALSTRMTLGTPRVGLFCCEINGFIYAVGGRDSVSYVTTNELYHAGNNSWSPRQPMLLARNYPAGAVANGKMYAIGGFTASNATTSSVERYDVDTNLWTLMAPMPTYRGGAGAATVNGIIYVIGGYAGIPASTSVAANEAFDPVANSWTTKAPLPVAINALAAVAVGGKIYVTGGYANREEATTHIYDPATDSWSVGPFLPEARYYHGMAVLDGIMYACGGQDSAGDARAFNDSLEAGIYHVFSKD